MSYPRNIAKERYLGDNIIKFPSVNLSNYQLRNLTEEEHDRSAIGKSYHVIAHEIDSPAISLFEIDEKVKQIKLQLEDLQSNQRLRSEEKNTIENDIAMKINLRLIYAVVNVFASIVPIVSSVMAIVLVLMIYSSYAMKDFVSASLFLIILSSMIPVIIIANRFRKFIARSE